jgi:hypothetical protein
VVVEAPFFLDVDQIVSVNLTSCPRPSLRCRRTENGHAECSLAVTTPWRECGTLQGIQVRSKMLEESTLG